MELKERNVASTYTPIATTTLGSAVNSVTFSSIPSTYTDLVLVIQYQSSANCVANITFNNDTATNYSTTYLSGSGTAAASTRGSNETSIGTVWSGANFNGKLGQIIVQVQNYSNTTTYKTIFFSFMFAGEMNQLWTGLWRNTAAINTITITGSGGATFAANSMFTLYGIQAA